MKRMKMAITKRNLQKYCSIVGAHFIGCPLSFVWIYGNLSAYTDSYFRFACYPKCTDWDPQWLLSLYVAGLFPGYFMVKPLEKIVGFNWTGIIAMVMVNAALLGSAWSLNVSIILTAVMYGALLGTGAGISSSLTIQVVSGWAPERAAVLVATTSGMASMLSVIQNQIITAFVNRNNLKPDAIIGPKAYFSQSEVLDHVPGILIIYGTMTIGMQIIGYLLITDPNRASCDSSKEATEGSKALTKHQNNEYEELGARDYTQNDQSKKHYGSNSRSSNCIDLLDVSNCSNDDHYGSSNVETIEENEGSKQKKDEIYSYTPREVLRSPVFYAVCFFGIAIEYGILLKSNFYKKFALLYIHNDKYLSLVGTLVPIISTGSRIFFGTLMDKHILSLKDVTIIGLSLNCVLCAFWFISARLNAILYMFLVLGLAAAQSLAYVVLPTAALRLFGPAHLSTNYGLVASCMLISSILSPVINSPLLHTFGWQWVFTTGSVFNLLVLCYVTVTNFKTQV
ncbi:oxalate:formate antiporter-like isoform x1 [Plakobranchus ocellatus]|uniref:Oxalate:formate antiporter-like isoform x1 n=1 Tax=Plakobranchus ocellatus TaxID=259542 RepID=A0AAV4C9J0_9GAST|nr:oxalate:formate antiporter-like isoform x1 [Plakobranchus ocellatus]